MADLKYQGGKCWFLLWLQIRLDYFRSGAVVEQAEPGPCAVLVMGRMGRRRNMRDILQHWLETIHNIRRMPTRLPIYPS